MNDEITIYNYSVCEIEIIIEENNLITLTMISDDDNEILYK